MPWGTAVYNLNPNAAPVGTERKMKMEDRQELNRNLAQMLKGGVIMDVTTPEQA